MNRQMNPKTRAKIEALPDESPAKALLIQAIQQSVSIEELAKRAGLTHQALYAIINRPFADCRRSTLRALESALSPQPVEQPE